MFTFFKILSFHSVFADGLKNKLLAKQIFKEIRDINWYIFEYEPHK